VSAAADKALGYILRVPAILTYDDLPKDVREKLDTLYRACDRRRYADAIAGLSEIVDAYPAYINAVYVLGIALRKTGDYRRATERFDAARALAPDDPRICLGAAWGRLDADDLTGAAALATHALDASTGKIRGHLLEVLAMAAEADGRTDDATRLFLESYEAGTMLDSLQAHCRLVGIDYAVGVDGATVPWPITAVERQWLFSEIGTTLCETARAKRPDLPLAKQLPAGCDNTAKVTARWARRAGVEPARLYQALADRGGFCDCEVLLNAASEDEETRGLALVVGAIDGDLDDGVAAFADLLGDDTPPADPRLEPAESPDEYMGIYIDRRSQLIPLQITDGATIGETLRGLSARPPTHAKVRLVIGFVDAPPAVVLAGRNGAALRIREVADGPVPMDLEAAWPGLWALVEKVRSRLP
jgi:tetratricopeptide (TPR) repeat protein